MQKVQDIHTKAGCYMSTLQYKILHCESIHIGRTKVNNLIISESIVGPHMRYAPDINKYLAIDI